MDLSHYHKSLEAVAQQLWSGCESPIDVTVLWAPKSENTVRVMAYGGQDGVLELLRSFEFDDEELRALRKDLAEHRSMRGGSIARFVFIDFHGSTVEVINVIECPMGSAAGQA